MPYLKNPSGRIVDVSDDRVDILVRQGFERIVNGYEPPKPEPVEEPEVSEFDDDEGEYTLEEGNAGWFYIMRNGEKVESVRGREAAEAKLAELTDA